MGIRGGLHRLLRNFDMAVDEHRAGAGTHWYRLDLAAIDNLSLEHVRCQCPVLGAWKEGLIVDYHGEARAVGKSALHHNLYPKNAVLQAGAPLAIATRRIDMRARSLGWLMDALQDHPHLYLLGELWIDAEKQPLVEDLERYHPVTWSGEQVRLHYARPTDLAAYRRLVAIRGETVIQAWGEGGAGLASLPLEAKPGRVELPRGLRGLF